MCAHALGGWDENWDVPIEKLKNDAVEAAAHFLAQQPPSEHT